MELLFVALLSQLTRSLKYSCLDRLENEHIGNMDQVCPRNYRCLHVNSHCMNSTEFPEKCLFHMPSTPRSRKTKMMTKMLFHTEHREVGCSGDGNALLILSQSFPMTSNYILLGFVFFFYKGIMGHSCAFYEVDLLTLTAIAVRSRYLVTV